MAVYLTTILQHARTTVSADLQVNIYYKLFIFDYRKITTQTTHTESCSWTDYHEIRQLQVTASISAFKRFVYNSLKAVYLKESRKDGENTKPFFFLIIHSET